MGILAWANQVQVCHEAEILTISLFALSQPLNWTSYSFINAMLEGCFQNGVQFGDVEEIQQSLAKYTPFVLLRSTGVIVSVLSLPKAWRYGMALLVSLHQTGYCSDESEGRVQWSGCWFAIRHIKLSKCVSNVVGLG